jgi:hypothetical protein
MNIIYLECKLLDITKRGFDFIGMSVINRFLIDNIWFLTFVSEIKGCGGLIYRRRGLGWHLGCHNRQSGHDGGGQRCPLLPSFVLLENEEQFIRPASPTAFILFTPQSNFCKMYFSVVISPNVIFFNSFLKSPCFHYCHCIVYIPFLEQCLYALSCSM